MEFTTKTITLFSALILTGLSAGLFYAWEFSVIPGTKPINNLAYLETMKSINRAIINPAFMLIFIGSLFAQILSIYQLRSTPSLWLFIFAATVYFLGTILVTSLGNVPLNNELEALNIGDMSQNKMATFRLYYEMKWNRLHSIRTLFSLISFILLATGTLKLL